MKSGTKKLVVFIGILIFLATVAPVRSAQSDVYTRLVVIPFDNLGDKEKAWLGGGIASAIGARLRVVKGLALVEPTQLAKAMEKLKVSSTNPSYQKAALQIGKAVGAKYAVIGNYKMSGTDVSINMKMVAIDGGAEKGDTKATGKYDDIFNMQDDLAKSVLKWLNITPSQAEIQWMAAATSRNPAIFESLSRADGAYSARKLDEASRWAAKALSIDPNDPYALTLAGDIQEFKGKYDEALPKYSSAAEIFRKKGNEKNYAEALINSGKTIFRQGKYDQALKLFQQSADIAGKIGDEAGVARALIAVGNVHTVRGEVKDALSYYQRSLEIKRKIGDQPGISSTLHDIGNLYLMQGQLDQALDYYTQSLDISKKIGDEANTASTLLNIGEVNRVQKKYDEALKYYKQSMEIARRLGDERTVADALQNIASVNFERKNFEEAISLYKRSLEMRRNMGDQGSAANLLTAIANVYSYQEKNAEALKYYKESLEITKKLGNKSGTAYNLAGIGASQAMMGKFKEARAAWEEAVKIYESIGDTGNASKIKEFLNKLHQEDSGQ